jgi:hypothetical protein
MIWSIPVRRSLFLSLLSVLFAGAAAAGTVNYTGAGGDFNDAYFDPGCPLNSYGGNVCVTTTTYTLSVSDSYLIDVGDAVTVSLAGLQYPFASDLEVSLTHDGVTEDLFNQIGGSGADPAQFGNSGSGTNAGNYTFNSAYQGSCPTGPPVTNCDLWITAGSLPSAGSIPDGDYYTTDINDSNNQLSMDYAAQSVTGNWVLTVTDYCPPFSDCVSQQDLYDYSPGIINWGLSIDVVGPLVPEPSMIIPTALSAGLLWWGIRRRAANSR